MSKGTPFTLQDLEAKGFFPDASGTYVWKKPEPAAVKKKKSVPKTRPIGLVAIENVLKVSGLQYVTEHVFSTTTKRKFRFDIAIIDRKIAIEYEGIFCEKSGHTGVKGYTKDCEKYNLAKIEGWTVLRYTAKNYKQFLDDLKQII